MSRRGFLVTGLLVTLLVAGVASFYASSHPDGLEYVAEKTGFLDTAEDSPDRRTARSPTTASRASSDPRLSGGLAGVLGVVTVLVLAGGLA